MKLTFNQKVAIVKPNQKGNKMERTEMITKITLLTEQVESLTDIKVHRLETEQAQKSEFFNWCRDQMIAIHQMKYQFSQEVDQIHQEWVRANTDARNLIDRVRSRPA